jgi:nitrogen fixation/metabolism regulation signal transduction histidine kinase
MPTSVIALNAFFIALLVAVIVGGQVWSIMTQHRVGGYESCRVRRRLQITLRLVPVDPPTPSDTVQYPLA